jgi:virginiamycin B lyase
MRWLKRATILSLSSAFAVTAAPAQEPQEMAAGEPQIQEWPVPYPESRPRDPYVGPDGRVWFVGQRSHYVAVFDPQSGEFEKYDLEDGTGPHNLIVDPEGAIYYAGNRAQHIGILHPESGEIEKIMMPDPAARDPHTLVWDSEGDIWFTVQGGNFVGHLDTGTREVRLVQAPAVEGSPRGNSSRPYGIVVDSNDRPWIALFNTNLIARVDPNRYRLWTYELPEDARPRRLVIDSSDAIWYVDYARGYLGRLDSASGAVEEWPSPGGAESRPYGMVIDQHDRIWYVETGPSPNSFVGFDTRRREFIAAVDIPSGAGAVRHMDYDPRTQAVWFGTDANTLGRALLPAAPSADSDN